MNAILPTSPLTNVAAVAPVSQPALRGKDETELRQAFDSFVGETFFGQMLKAMRKSVGKPAYFHGGRGEEIFQEMLDQTLAEDIARASADQFTGPMFELFTMQRK
ncbi:MAG: rod-binding protein [Pirellulales bacterium]|nr:rod-binding protein [Pirellulales bacterium]